MVLVQSKIVSYRQLVPTSWFSKTIMSMATYDETYLRKQMMINQFCNTVGCTDDQAQQMLTAAQWSMEVAYSLFFQDHSTGVNNGISMKKAYQHCVPNNTPVTPSQLPDLLNGLSQLTAGGGSMDTQQEYWPDRKEKCEKMADHLSASLEQPSPLIGSMEYQKESSPMLSPYQQSQSKQQQPFAFYEMPSATST